MLSAAAMLTAALATAALAATATTPAAALPTPHTSSDPTETVPAPRIAATPADGPRFQTSDRCFVCHNGTNSTTGLDVTIGADWRSSLMANSSRDPYWQASVRRETMDHPHSGQTIEDECSICHMPVARYHAKLDGKSGQVFSHLPLRLGRPEDREAADGVTCTVCHQISATNLGTPASFTGGFAVDGSFAGAHLEYGPFDIDPGLQTVMHSSTGGFMPARGDHIRTSELCATCHTLVTKALDTDGHEIGSLPEQMPYQEWLHSDFRYQRSCQDCHMPKLPAQTPIARIFSTGRTGAARHEFVAANFFVQRILSRYHDDLAVSATPQELMTAADRTEQYLKTQAARVTISQPELHPGTLEALVTVENLGGHKLPTAYPSRRAWLHILVHDRHGATVFESGALLPDGSIAGNDNDSNPKQYEPHYQEIRSGDQVQVYEAILRDAGGNVTTGLLSATGYLKDNRLLPVGFDKKTADEQIAVHGTASNDPDFTDHGDRVRYVVAVGRAEAPYEVIAELWYQPIGFRWATNLKSYAAAEPRRFTEQYDAMSEAGATILASAHASVP
jgi:hypothetical protein